VRVADDGRGIAPERAGDGHGLASMGQRARELGGALEIAANGQGGTVVTLRAPIRPRRRARPYADA
jgi:signal transduction histidine kinase